MNATKLNEWIKSIVEHEDFHWLPGSCWYYKYKPVREMAQNLKAFPLENGLWEIDDECCQEGLDVHDCVLLDEIRRLSSALETTEYKDVPFGELAEIAKIAAEREQLELETEGAAIGKSYGAAGKKTARL